MKPSASLPSSKDPVNDTYRAQDETILLPPIIFSHDLFYYYYLSVYT